MSTQAYWKGSMSSVLLLRIVISCLVIQYPLHTVNADDVLSSRDTALACTFTWRDRVVQLHNQATSSQLESSPIASLEQVTQAMDDMCARTSGSYDSKSEAADTITATAVSEQHTCQAHVGETSNPKFSLDDWASHKFISIHHLSEQLSKGRRHLTEVVALAALSQRTLILPKVYRSRIGFPGWLPFCAYFDVVLLGKYVPWVTEDFHIRLMRHLERPPSLFLIYLTQTRFSPRLKYDFSPPHLPTLMILLALSHAKTFIESDTSSVGIILHKPPKRKNHMDVVLAEERILLKFFSKHHDIDVFILDKNTYHPSIAHTHLGNALAHVEYAPQLIKRSKVMSTRLGDDYVALHLRLEWLFKPFANAKPKNARMEGAMIAQLHKCTRSAAKVVSELVVKNGWKVFIASDTAYERRVATGVDVNETVVFKSDTCSISSKLRVEVLNAIKVLWDNLSPLTSSKLDSTIVEADGGVQAILEKLVCSRATIFVAGYKGCGGMRSFDAGILKYRKASRNVTQTNIVKRF